MHIVKDMVKRSIEKNLVFLCGWNRRPESYKRFVECAPKGWRLIFVPYYDSVGSKVNDIQGKILDYLAKRNIKRCCLVGHSLGGGLAMLFATCYPHMVEHLYLCDSVGIKGGPGLFKDILYAWKIDPKYKHLEVESRTFPIKRILGNPVGSLRLGLLARTLDLEEKAQTLKASTTLFWGARDKLIPVWKGKRLQRLIPDSRLIILDDVGHDWMMTHPGLFWEHIR